MQSTSNLELAPWRSPLARALHRNRSLPNARYVQLATVRPDGTPANRTIVFRGFASAGNELQFVSDRRSEKIAQIRSCAIAEVCWYFPKTREQFRLLGSLSLIVAETPPPQQELRQRLWQDLSDNARLQFTWPDPGGDRADASAFAADPPDTSEPLPEFCVLLLQPTQVDFLELRGEPQNRWFYQLDRDQTWQERSLNP